MAIFFKTPAPPGVCRAGACDSVVVRAEGLFEHRQLVRRRAPLACLWTKGTRRGLSARWSAPNVSVDSAGEPRQFVAAR